MSRCPVTVGDVVRNEFRWGPQPNSKMVKCPGCHLIISPTQSHCDNCKTTFVPIAPGHVQVVGVREGGTPGTN